MRPTRSRSDTRVAITRAGRHAFWRARFARIYPVYLLAYLAAALPFA